MAHGVSSVSPNLTTKRNQFEYVSPTSFSGSPDEEQDESQTPPNVTMTWRTVQSRTPPRYPSMTRKYPEDDDVKEVGKMVLQDIMISDEPSSSTRTINPSTLTNQSSHQYKNVRIPEKSPSSRPIRSGSKPTSSPSLRDMLEADKQRTESAKVIVFPSIDI